ncbi:MAG: class I tRNA ligase family protein [bacterium]|nr:class I tRNA ligase family protein [bacterium]
MSKRFYITTPIYYVNDRPHVGTAYTTIAADVVARWHRQRGDEVFFLTGTDEHGAKAAESAAKAGKSPEEFTAEIAQLFQLAWKNLNIKYDDFIRTTEKRHARSVEKFMQLLKDNDAIYKGTYEGLYCVGCEKFITEKELVDGKCPLHNRVPEKIKEKNYFFRLTKYLDTVRRLIETDEIVIEPVERKKEALGLFQQGLEDFSVSREKVKWGIPLPFDSKQVIYVWVEALQNYVSAIGYGDDIDRFHRWWPVDVQLMAKDILKFHAIYWPAMLLAVGEKAPKKEFIHGFFSINGKKMGKSLGNTIDPNDMVEKFGSDGARYLLLSQFPFGQDGDIQESRFVEKYNADLANGLGNLVSRTANLMEKYAVENSMTDPGIASDKIEEIESAIQELSLENALKKIFQLIAEVNKYLDAESPWKMDDSQAEKRAEVLRDCAARVRRIARLVYPFLPIASRRIERQFSESLVKKEDPLFPRIQA